MIERLRQRRAGDEQGFTLIELLVVIIILGILLAIAVPAYLKFKDRANTTAAQANIASVVPAVEAYGADHAGYVGMNVGTLKASYDAGVKNVSVISASASTYCIKSTSAGTVYYKNGPSADITTTVCV